MDIQVNRILPPEAGKDYPATGTNFWTDSGRKKRLYRQRNLILHGARLDSVVLTASLRTVAKLAGAGMDRITHGHYVQKLKPLELVAKANLALTLVSRESPLNCC